MYVIIVSTVIALPVVLRRGMFAEYTRQNASNQNLRYVIKDVTQYSVASVAQTTAIEHFVVFLFHIPIFFNFFIMTNEEPFLWSHWALNK